MKNNTTLNILLILVIGLFCMFMANLFSLRFKAGDIYPEYSSLRTDPLGAKVLFESLQHIGTVNVRRNYQPIRLLKDMKNNCLLFLGVASGKTHMISRQEYQQITKMAESGTRMIIALKPTDLYSFKKASKPEAPRPPANRDNQVPVEDNVVDLFEQLNIAIEYDHASQGRFYTQPGEISGLHNMFKPISWPFALWFRPGSPDWETIAFVKHKPVIIEKKFNQGSIVLASDTFMFSNESLRNNNASPLLSFLFADKKNIIFDEYHLGIQKHPGLSTLIRKYNLYGALGIIALFIVLFIWKNAYSLLPVDKQNEIRQMLESDSGQLHSKDNLSGLVNLLKQHIPVSELINECKSTWKAAFILNKKPSKKYQILLHKIESETHPKHEKKKPVEAYQRLCRILSEKEENERVH